MILFERYVVQAHDEDWNEVTPETRFFLRASAVRYAKHLLSISAHVRVDRYHLLLTRAPGRLVWSAK